MLISSVPYVLVDQLMTSPFQFPNNSKCHTTGGLIIWWWLVSLPSSLTKNKVDLRHTSISMHANAPLTFYFSGCPENDLASSEDVKLLLLQLPNYFYFLLHGYVFIMFVHVMDLPLCHQMEAK